MSSFSELSRTELDQVLLKRAIQVRLQSEDPKFGINPSSGVGAVIFANGQILSESANRLPPRLSKTIALTDVDDERRYTHIEHAERAAIFFALNNKEKLDGATMYCTRFPCSDCARAISFSGIQRLVVAEGFGGEKRWIDEQRAALDVLRNSGVTVRYLTSLMYDSDTHHIAPTLRR